MTATAAETALLPVAPEGVRWTRTSLEVTDPGLPYETFEGLVGAAGTFGDAARWWLGDLLLFGEARYGHEYAQALEVARVGEHTLGRYRLVCERIARSRRRPNLSFSHHVEVAPLQPADQDRLLAQAEDGDWPVVRLREAVRDLRALQAHTPRGRQEVVGASFEPVGALSGLEAGKDALALTYQHLRDPARVDSVEVAEAIPAALRGIDEAIKTVLAAEARSARPALVDVARRIVRAATRSSGFAMIPLDEFEAFVVAVDREEGAA